MSTLPSKPTLYYIFESPPCHTVIAVSRLLGVDLELKPIDATSGEHKTRAYAKVSSVILEPFIYIIFFFSFTR